MEFKNERELQLDLAKFLRDSGLLTYTEIKIKDKDDSRADVIAIKPHIYSNKDFRIYEAKNTRSAFENDYKYLKYFDVCHKLYIACPSGLIQKDELPKKVGLIVRNKNSWHVVKAAKRNEPKELTVDFMLSLLNRGYEESIQQRRLRDRIRAEDNVRLSLKAKNIGHEIAKRLDKDRETEVENWVLKCVEIFKKYLGVDISSYGYKGLPSLRDLEYILKSMDNFSKDLEHIRAIGDYLRNLDLPEEPDTQKKINRCRKQYRDKAMEFTKNKTGDGD